MNKYITPVSMAMSEPQFLNDIKVGLDKLGYMYVNPFSSNRDHGYIITNFATRGGDYGWNQSAGPDWRYRVPSYNPKLFLALAAMTEGHTPISGEYLIALNRFDAMEIGDIVQVQHISHESLDMNSKAWIHTTRQNGDAGGFRWGNRGYRYDQDFRKATKDELINFFGCENTADIQYMSDRFPFKLSAEQALDIINIACNTWKVLLSEDWAVDIVLQKDIIITEAVYTKMRKACTKDQHKLFDSIFGKDEDILPKGTICWVSMPLSEKFLRVADGKGKFYINGGTTGVATSWSNYEVIKLL